jgi:hypothetical protein
MGRPAEQTDEYVIERIRQSFAHDPRLNELELHVNLIDDRVLVTGTVQTADRRDAISAVLSELVPERRVENLTRLIDTGKGAESETLP